ncbi:MAG: beta-ketoacyl synthase N-terminal-like domain-containing protein, partial [Acidimicrobiales bacterium]
MLLAHAGPDGTGALAGRRVAITGMGVVASCGIGKQAFWEGLLRPQIPGIRRVVDMDASSVYGPKELRRTDRFTQFVGLAAAEALDEVGGVEALGVDPDRVGVMIGTGVGGLQTLQTQVTLMLDRGPERVSPFLVPMLMGNRAAADVSIRYGLRGPCEATVTACAAGTHSVSNAARLVAMGRCDVVLAGSAEAPLCDVGIAGFTNMTALSPRGISMPFDARRDGFVLGEGGAVLILEELGRARARGAHIYAEVAGAASTTDAHHVTAPAPDGSGATICMELALV